MRYIIQQTDQLTYQKSAYSIITSFEAKASSYHVELFKLLLEQAGL